MAKSSGHDWGDAVIGLIVLYLLYLLARSQGWIN